jgi:hypothetical protein
VADRTWDINEFVMFARARGASWKELYWKIWGRLVSFKCKRCEKPHVASDINFCTFHTQKAKFFPSSNEGTYLCCGAPAIRFDTAVEEIGCSAIPHVISIPDDVKTESETEMFKVTHNSDLLEKL